MCLFEPCLVAPSVVCRQLGVLRFDSLPQVDLRVSFSAAIFYVFQKFGVWIPVALMRANTTLAEAATVQTIHKSHNGQYKERRGVERDGIPERRWRDGDNLLFMTTATRRQEANNHE